MELADYKLVNFELIAIELLQNYNDIYNGSTICSDIANLLVRSQSKWAEYSIRDLCLYPINFEYIETTSNKLLGKHNLRFAEIIKLIYALESHIPFDSRLKILTYKDNVIIQIVHHFTIRVKNPYSACYDTDVELSHLVFNECVIDKIKTILSEINFKSFRGSEISL